MSELNTGANEQGIAAPETQTQQQPEQAQPQAAQQQPVTDTKPTQSMEERAAFAERRRQSAGQIKHELDVTKQRLEAFAKARGFESFDEMERSSEAELLEQGKLTPEILAPMVNRAVDNHPAVQAALAITENAVVESDMKVFLDGDLKDEGIRSVDDFIKMPKFDTFKTFVDQGLTYEQAYKLTNWDELQQKGRAAAKQQTMNAVNGKSHMTGTEQGEVDDLAGVVVPADVMANYRAMLPHWSESKIKQHYSKQQKG